MVFDQYLRHRQIFSERQKINILRQIGGFQKTVIKVSFMVFFKQAGLFLTFSRNLNRNYRVSIIETLPGISKSK